jgi:hypothetical protein
MRTLQNIQTLIFLTLLVSLTSCNLSIKKEEKVWSELPKVTILGNLKHTDFVPTLENSISENKNIIYAPAFLYAWDKVEQELNSPIKIRNSNTIDFKLLTESNSFQSTLNDSEYEITTEIVGEMIIAKAFFNKTLPFETKLQKLDEPILFDKTKVSAFGMNYYDEETVRFTQILYYSDDNNFILKLTPKDTTQEIILVKGLDKITNLAQAFNQTNILIEKGKTNKLNPKLSWKYEILVDDRFAIPIIKFNLATNYRQFEGQTFSTADNKKHQIQIAYQRTGFIFDENGAVVESEGGVAVDSASAEPIITYPKKMILDKPFYIFIKRTDKKNPYFVMKVENSELLTKK